MSDPDTLATSNQEQAVAAWIGYLNHLRITTLLGTLGRQEESLQAALDHIDAAITKIGREVVGTNRGGVKGMHGFIAEVAEVGVGNARSTILGNSDTYRWVNDNGPIDLLRSGIPIQQKFVAAGGRLGLGAIAEHLQRYPDFIANGGKYQIPRDHYDTIRQLHATPFEDASTLLSRSGEGPSFRDWERVHAFFSNGAVSIETLEPSQLGYHDVQRNTFSAALETEKESLRTTDQALRDQAHRASRSSIREGAKATVIGAAAEGGTTFGLALAKKRREGTPLRQFTSNDWIEMARATGSSFATGGVRGLSLYTLTNLTRTSAATANMVVTASFSLAEQAHRLRLGHITETEFVENAELVCLEAGVSALSSALGQALIPIPILGAVIGNTIGTIMFNAAAASLSTSEAALLERYLDDQRALNDTLTTEHDHLIAELEASMLRYLALLEEAFSPDTDVAFLGSIELAQELGVSSTDILDTEEKTNSYFLD